METVLTNVEVTISGRQMKDIKKMTTSVKKQVVEALNYLKFNIKEGNLKVELQSNKYNNSFILKRSFEVESEGSGSFLVPVNAIRQLKNIKNNDKFKFKNIKNNVVELIKNNATQTIYTLEVNKFPKVQQSKFDYIGSVNYDEILNLNKALLSVGKSEFRPVLHSVLIRDGKIITTDSHRLFKANSQINYSDDIKLNPSGVKKLKDMFNKKDDNISIFVNDQYIKFELDNKVVMIKQLEGKYPEVDRIIPIDFNIEFIVDNTEQFEQIVKDASEVSKEHPNNVIHFEIVGGQLKITSKSAYGSYENSVEINKISLEDGFKISMNGKYILDAIKQVESNQLHFKFIDHLRPFIITKPNNDNVLALVLPVRTY